jgi:death-on-curing protein
LKIITVRQILTLHEFEIKKYGGSSGIRDIGMLKSAIGRPFATFNGEDLYSDIYTKSAALIQSIAKNHPFVDGNKRTSFVTAAVFLRLNRYLFEVPQKEVVDYILRVVNENLSVDEISAWIKKHTKIT